MVCITLSGVIATIILASGPWSWNLSYDELCLTGLQPIQSQKMTDQLPRVGFLEEGAFMSAENGLAVQYRLVV
ncbi:hypothetical protein DSO57_1002501 [Entomophthora muscae]|uniref:Uncharacterized protein n=1 Tax=Entomophthora muscae TaxID=34485 RepID=A0ACC2SM16_9FUNG|nr:hypothetical protein DSO57_1002501 [Entomophthora muscae]